MRTPPSIGNRAMALATQLESVWAQPALSFAAINSVASG
jgi:hypothetical protein